MLSQLDSDGIGEGEGLGWRSTRMLGGNSEPSNGCELEVFAVEISRISRGSMFALFAWLYKASLG